MPHPANLDPETGLAIPGFDSDAFEDERQRRITAGLEMECRVCGCSDTRACPGGCIWAAPFLCSRCARGAKEPL